MSEEKIVERFFDFLYCFNYPLPLRLKPTCNTPSSVFSPLPTRNMHRIFRLAHLGPFGMGAGWAGFFFSSGGGGYWGPKKGS